MIKSPTVLRTKLFQILLAACLGLSSFAHAQVVTDSDRQLTQIDVVEQLGDTISLELAFTNGRGERVPLSTYFRPEKPVLLVLAYYDCPMLCTLVLNGILTAVQQTDWTPGNEFQMLTISVDPRETPELAEAKQKTYLSRFDPPVQPTAWEFLVGDAAGIKSLTESLGFEYFYDEKLDEFAHPAVGFVLTGDGRISRYLYGINFSPRDLKLSLLEASEGRIGNAFDKLLLYCYQYDPEKGGYAVLATNVMKIGGLATVSIIILMLVIFWGRELRRRTNRDNQSTKSVSPPQ